MSSPGDLVALFLRGQNLEQMHRFDEAAEHYEQAVTAGFDAAGPYDRLLYLYRDRGDDQAIVRVATAALANVRAFDQKMKWYADMAANATARIEAGASDPSGAEF